ncbi:MAG: 4-(cytidine 5'-diphospho)-2-C-methyl-D-erythritol kinase [Candidatus Latescibacteria bacterium]|nr:4-(cytidine 5'-diphospho)-2-C-methyl-D-erythritol kinase [bacterium]MBD3425294.1 4-(cytidine 5'-diphospho)-2-C-methyl-D-erythritol kinase [Candidatus Latescibacterota bacterium]
MLIIVSIINNPFSGKDLPVECHIECRAKINLYLGITGRREDGYHDIETVFQPVSICDHIRVTDAPSGIALCRDDDSIKWDRDNLCYRAAERLFKAAGYRRGVKIEVRKKIPHGAGLGGGSSDAAGVLLGLNSFLKLGLSRNRLIEIALGIGSDIPFFVYNQPAIGRGRGEILEGIDGIRGVYILLVMPDIRVNTSVAYKKNDLMLTKDESRYKLGVFLEGLNRIPRGRIRSHNTFEESVCAGYPEIEEILFLLRENEDSIFSSISGSGSTCFSVFADKDEADDEYHFITGKGYRGLVVEPREKTIRLEC